MIEGLLEAIVHTALELAAALMHAVFVRPFRALFGLQDPLPESPEDEEANVEEQPLLESAEPAPPDQR